MIERENIEWTQHYWYDVAAGMEHLPRVLLIGDSIVQQSREFVRDRLKELAIVSDIKIAKKQISSDGTVSRCASLSHRNGAHYTISRIECQ
mgnify:CR=1 FL=1